jgi:hypothetical protein
LWRGLSLLTLHARQGLQRGICALVFVDATCAGVTRHREPSLKERVDILRPAGLTATRPVMRNIYGARRLLDPVLIDAFSRFFILQGSFLLLSALAHVVDSVEYRILCIHDFPSMEFLLPWL